MKQTIQISEIKSLLNQGKTVKVKTLNGEYVDVVDYYEKGILPTYKVTLSNGCSIKTSKAHRFFTSQGWLETNELKPSITKILCDDGEYHSVSSVDYIGEYPIVDIQVNSEDHSYFGNGMLNHNSGKSLLAAHALASTQQSGGVAVMIDTESAVSREFLEAIGVDISKLLYIPSDSLEGIFEYIETIIEKVREKSKDRPVTIVVDSVAAASTEKELEADYGKDGYATDKAIILSKAMRKITNVIGREKITLIFTNQLRQKMNAMPFSDPWCVDPLTTKIKIRYSTYMKNGQLSEEELTLAEFADRFLGVNDYSTPNTYDTEDLNVEVLTLDNNGDEVYRTIQSFLVKETVDEYYTDGRIKVTSNHRFIENGETIFAKDHPEFNKVVGNMYVVDIEVADLHSYLANGRLNHNTTSGGKSISFHSSVIIRLTNAGTIKTKINGIDISVGIKVKAQIKKNRMGPPLRTTEFEIYFDRGIDNYGAWFKVMKDYGLFGGSGSWYTYIDDESGEIIKFQSKDWIQMMEERDDIREQVYNKLCEALILKYKSSTSTDLDALELDTSDGEAVHIEDVVEE
jgi:RecA/RadA recombinase